MPDLIFLDLPRHFPKEFPQKIYLAYFQLPKGQFRHCDEEDVFRPISALRNNHRALYDEIINTLKYVPSTPQTLKLESCYDHATGFFLGSPKQIMGLGDYVNSHYLIINIKFVNVSYRDENGVDTIRLGKNHGTHNNLEKIFEVEEHNRYLTNLKQVRYDFEYGDENEMRARISLLSSS